MVKHLAAIAALRLLPTIIVVVLWQVGVNHTPSLDFTMGSPAGIAREIGVLLKTGTLFRDFGVTLLETLLGFLAGTVVGTALGLLLWRAKTAYDLLRPYLLALGALPIIALGPMMIFWFGTGMLSKVILGFLATVVVAITQSYSGACEADTGLLRMVQAFGGTRRQAFWKIVLPSAALWVVAGVRINVSMALLGAFVGEFIASRMGLGHLIIAAEGLYNVNQIWVGVGGILLIAFLFHLNTVPLEAWANRLKPSND
jgi:NitT/TauT family transport system permease protein